MEICNKNFSNKTANIDGKSSQFTTSVMSTAESSKTAKVKIIVN